MIQWIKNKIQKKRDLKAIEQAFQLARHLYPTISQSKRIELRDAIRDLVDDYHMTWGSEDGVAKFYNEQLCHFEVVYHYKEKRENKCENY